jgi:predicted patatin/cPLA2 family phospholipase
MKHLGISGGGTKIAGLFGAAEVLLKEKNFKPDIISGISAGAILSVPLAMRKFDIVKEIVLNLSLNTFFSESPVTSDGSIRLQALWKAISGKPYLGRQGNLEKTIRKVISRQEFEAYRLDDTMPICLIGAVDFITGKRYFFNLKEVSYEDFPRMVNASSSIPVFTNGIQLTVNGKKTYLYDGGVRDHIASHYVLAESIWKDRFTESISIFSRPADCKALPGKFDDRNLVTVLSRYVDIANVEISKNDELLLNDYCNLNNVKNTILYLPQVMTSTFDINHKRLRELYDKGAEEARKGYGPTVVAV